MSPMKSGFTHFSSQTALVVLYYYKLNQRCMFRFFNNKKKKKKAYRVSYDFTHTSNATNQITDSDLAAAQQVGYRAELHNVAYSSTEEKTVRDLPPVHR